MTGPLNPLEQGPLRPPAETSATTGRGVPGTNGATATRGRRPIKYPVQLRVNINNAMAASMKRVCQRLGIPEGIGARIAISQFLSQQDPQYKGE